MSDLLMDKVISVRLVVERKSQAVMTITNTQGTTLYVYKGFSHDTYTKGSEVATKVVARGNTYKFNMNIPSHVTYFYKGESLKGNLLEKGDILYITEKGITRPFHLGELDTGVNSVQEEIMIDCPDYGMKPTIHFSTNVLQGMNCYETVVRITNLSIGMDIRNITYLVITAGYRDGAKTSFTCPVFASYVESPAPDSVTVFRCVGTGSTRDGDPFNINRPVTINYYPSNITLKELITKVCGALKLSVNNYLADEFNNLDVPQNEIRDNMYATSGISLLDWLRQVITDRIRIEEKANIQILHGGEEVNVVVQLNHDKVYIYCTNRVNAGESIVTATYPVLDAVKSASFSGPILTVKALWNPAIMPGEVFKMVPSIYNGNTLPNILSRLQYGDDPRNDYRYRVITQSIVFSTTGTDNEMTLLAVPISHIPNDLTDDEKLVTSIDNFVQSTPLLAALNTDTSPNILNIGNPPEDGSDIQEDPVKEASNKAFSIQLDFAFKSVKVIGKNGSVQTDDDYYGRFNSLSEIAEYYYERSGLELPKNKNILYGDLWPLISILTYAKWVESNSSSTINVWNSFGGNLNNPTSIRAGDYVAIPIISSWDSLKSYRDIFQYFITMYEGQNISGMEGYPKRWENLYNYLGD